MIKSYNVIKKKSLNKRRGFSKVTLSFQIITYLNYVYVNIYIFKF